MKTPPSMKVCCPKMLRALTNQQGDVPPLRVDMLAVHLAGMPSDPYEAIGDSEDFKVCPWCQRPPLTPARWEEGAPQ